LGSGAPEGAPDPNLEFGSIVTMHLLQIKGYKG